MHFLAAVLLVLFAVLLDRNAPTVPPTSDEAAFERLFDGSTLAGWSGDPAFWSVEDGAIVGRTSAATPLTHNTFLIHEDVFGDFELRLRYRIHGGNSGIQYRSRDRGAFTVSGYQADIEAGPNYTGILYEEQGRGILAMRGDAIEFGTDGTRTVGLRLGDAAKLQTFIRKHDWNDYVVVARGPRLIHRINGVTVVDVIDRDPTHRARAGHLALQLHQGPPMEVRFADVRIRPLTTAAAEPEWIWAQGDAELPATATLSRTFALDEAPRFARLTIAADNRHRTRINGRRVAEGDDWSTPGSFDVSRALRFGDNVITIEAANEGGPAGVHASLELDFDGGRHDMIVTDTHWTCDAAPAGPRTVTSLGPVSAPLGPWPAVIGAAEATPASSITVQDGFDVERLVSAGPGEGSWVALCCDPKGRFIVSPQYGNLLRITLPTKPGRVPLVEPVDLPLGHAQGLTWAHDSLYVVANAELGGNGGVWRCRDADGDGRYEAVDRIFACGPDGEHGAHGICEGPDGRMYVVLGNHVTDVADGQAIQDGRRHPPAAFAATSPLTLYDEDLTLPRAWDPNGHAVGNIAPGGVVVSMEPDGARLELVAGGFRNAYDLAFSAQGELFTYDSDMEWDVGLPWYRPTRVCHVVPGADFGWRSGSGKWPAHWFDSKGAVVDVGLGSPTGVAFATATDWPAPWRDAFLICDWTYGRILAVTLEARGATYSGRVTPFAQGKPLNVTDLVVGPDRALYVLTGGRGTQSGLYRIDARTSDPTSYVAPAVDPSVQRRRALEAMLATPANARLPEILEALDAEDPAVRYAARVVLEHQAIDAWRPLALAELRPRARFEMLLALARSEPAAIDAIAEALARAPFSAADEAAATRELRVLAVALARGGVPSDPTRERLLARLDAAFPSASFTLDRDLYGVLAPLAAPALAKRALGLLERASASSERIWWGWVLRDARTQFDAEEQARFAAAVEPLRGLSGGYSMTGYVGTFLPEPPPQEQPAPLAAVPAASPSPASAATAWTVASLLAEASRLDAGRSFEHGAAAFQTARCAECHRMAGAGGGIGPDLTGASGRFTRRDLLEAILEPSKVVSDQYAQTEFTTFDGRTVIGRLVDESAKELTIVTDALANRRETLRADTVRSRRPVTTSPMPEHLLDALELERILDLLAYIEAGADAQAKPFTK
jgi:putative heme-binding domain-containing protein